MKTLASFSHVNERGLHDLVAEPRLAADEIGGRHVRGWVSGALMLLMLATVATVFALRMYGKPFWTWGDQAVIEFATRRAMSAQQLLGPYSRFHYSNPGPAMFYLLVPFYAIFGRAAWSLPLGVIMMTIGSLVAAVLVVRDAAGEGAARWAAFVAGCYLVAGTPDGVWVLWNPTVAGPALLLEMVLAAAAWKGSAPSLLGAFIAASFATQSHVGVAAMAVPTLVVAVAGFAWARRKGRQERRRPGGEAMRKGPSHRLAAGVLACILAVMWVPTLIEQVEVDPGNLTRVADFLAGKGVPADLQQSHRPAEAVAQVATQASVIPFGPYREVLAPPLRKTAARAIVAAGWFLLAVAVAVVGYRRRERLACVLGIVSAMGFPLAVLAAIDVVGPLWGYLLWWVAALPVPALIGVGVLVLEGSGRYAGVLRRRVASTALAVLACVPLIVFTLQMAFTSWGTMGLNWGTDLRAVPVQLKRDLNLTSPGQVLLVPTQPQWQSSAALVNGLDSLGVRPDVPKFWLFMFGDLARPTGRELAEIIVTDSGTAPVPSFPTDRKLLDTQGIAIWLRPLAGA